MADEKKIEIQNNDLSIFLCQKVAQLFESNDLSDGMLQKET
jgi:hypothetical protein